MGQYVLCGSGCFDDLVQWIFGRDEQFSYLLHPDEYSVKLNSDLVEQFGAK